MVYRKDLARVAADAQEKSGFDFDIVYNFLSNVCKVNRFSVKTIAEKIKATPGKIYIDSENMLFNAPQSYTANVVSTWDDDGAAYWEGRILARQEAYNG